MHKVQARNLRRKVVSFQFRNFDLIYCYPTWNVKEERGGGGRWCAWQGR